MREEGTQCSNERFRRSVEVLSNNQMVDARAEGRAKCVQVGEVATGHGDISEKRNPGPLRCVVLTAKEAWVGRVLGKKESKAWRCQFGEWGILFA